MSISVSSESKRVTWIFTKEQMEREKRETKKKKKVTRRERQEKSTAEKKDPSAKYIFFSMILVYVDELFEKSISNDETKKNHCSRSYVLSRRRPIRPFSILRMIITFTKNYGRSRVVCGSRSSVYPRHLSIIDKSLT